MSVRNSQFGPKYSIHSRYGTRKLHSG